MSINTNHERARVCKAARQAVQKGLINGGSDFLSCRIPDTDHILTTPGDLTIDALKADDLLRMDQKGNVVDASPHRPPDALEFILSAFQMRSEVNAIGHFHPPRITAFSELDVDLIIPTSDKGKSMGEVLRVTCQTCTSRFAGLCSCFENRSVSYTGVNALLIKDDGIVTLDRNMEGVIERAVLIEKSMGTIVSR